MGIMGIDLRHFRCFVAVAEELHFHRAAKRLGVAQPALSRTIKNLETSLGFPLFDRSNRRVELSDAGRTFLKGCREVLDKAQIIVEDTRRVHQGKTGTLRIGYTDNAMNGRAPRMLKLFQDATPEIALLLTHSVTSQQLNMLDEGAIDVGFATGSIQRPGFASIRIQSENFVCVVHQDHPFAERSSLNMGDLIDEPMIQGVKEHWEHFYAYLTPLFRGAGFEPRVVQEGLTTSDIQRLVSCGMGIAVLTETVIETLAPDLKAIPIADVADRLDTIVIWKETPANFGKSQFIQFLNNAFKDKGHL